MSSVAADYLHAFRTRSKNTPSKKVVQIGLPGPIFIIQVQSLDSSIKFSKNIRAIARLLAWLTSFVQ